MINCTSVVQYTTPEECLGLLGYSGRHHFESWAI